MKETIFTKPLEAGTTFSERSNLDLEKEVSHIYSLISEMDKKGYTFYTLPAKNFIGKSLFDEKGKLRVTRIDRLAKIVNNIYYTYLSMEKLKQESEDSDADIKPTKLNYINIPVEGIGYNAIPNYIEFHRQPNTPRWTTSQIGIGYNTTGTSFPDWLEKAIIKQSGLSSNSSYLDQEHQYKSWIYQGTVFQLPAIITQMWMQHENGNCDTYSFEFSTKEAADRFAVYLNEARTNALEHMDKNEQLRKVLRACGREINISALIRLDEGIAKRVKTAEQELLRRGFSHYDIDYFKRALMKEVYEKYLQKISTIGVTLSPKEELLHPINQHQLKLKKRIEKIDWQLFDDLLINFEKELFDIAARYKAETKAADSSQK